MKNEITLAARRKFCGECLDEEGGLIVTHDQARLLKRGGVIRQGMNWGMWDDSFNTMPRNGKGLKPVAAFGFSWLNYLARGGSPWVYLSGECGMGKTHLACVLAVTWAIVKDRVMNWSKRGRVPALFVNWSDWLNDRRESYSDSEVQVSLRPLISVPFLVLDDVGLELTAHSLKHLYLLLEARRTKPTILTSNIKLSELRARLKGVGGDAGDWAEKVRDRLAKGTGGSVSAELVFASRFGSYRSVQG